MLVDKIWTELYLVQREGQGKFGPFTNMKEVYECVVKEELHNFELQTILSYIPF